MGSFKFKTVEMFIGEDLPRLVQGKQQMTAFFATYNVVRGHDNGLVKHGKGGLTIWVQNGDVIYSDVAFGMLAAGVFNPSDPVMRIVSEAGNRKLNAQAATAQAQVEQALADQPAIVNAENILAVVYAGLSAFDKAVAFASSLRAQHSHATVVVLTCDCQLESKGFELKPLMERGVIDYALATPECGGRKPMRTLLEALVAAWPKT